MKEQILHLSASSVTARVSDSENSVWTNFGWSGSGKLGPKYSTLNSAVPINWTNFSQHGVHDKFSHTLRIWIWFYWLTPKTFYFLNVLTLKWVPCRKDLLTWRDCFFDYSPPLGICTYWVRFPCCLSCSILVSMLQFWSSNKRMMSWKTGDWPIRSKHLFIDEAMCTPISESSVLLPTGPPVPTTPALVKINA